MSLAMDVSSRVLYVGDRHAVTRVRVGGGGPGVLEVTRVCGGRQAGSAVGNSSISSLREPRHLSLDGAAVFLYINELYNFQLRLCTFAHIRN